MGARKPVSPKPRRDFYCIVCIFFSNAMAAITDGFEGWLYEKLKSLNTDQDVFGNYIKGILEGSETDEEKREALEGILLEVSESNITELCNEIFEKWTASYAESKEEPEPVSTSVDDTLVSIMEKQARSVVTNKNVNVEDQKLKETILAQYAQVSDEENDVSDNGGVPDGSGPSTHNPTLGHSRKANVEAVIQAEKEKKEKAKAEHEKKKAQDKLNREKQKQQQQERKEKEKKRTQKGERKR